MIGFGNRGSEAVVVSRYSTLYDSYAEQLATVPEAFRAVTATMIADLTENADPTFDRKMFLQKCGITIN